MKEDKNRDAVDTELKELEDDQEVTKFAKKFIAELLFWPRKKSSQSGAFSISRYYESDEEICLR